MLIINPTTGQILETPDPTAYYQQGYRDPTADELEHAARVEEFGSFEQQAQAQAERVVRGATFGAVEGFGSEEDNRARAEVSEELSPVTSFAASVAPDLGMAALTGGLGGLATGAGRAAGRAALAEGAGIVRAGLSAARAGGAAALAAESVGTGLVAAGQTAYAEGREFEDDPGRFAEDALMWGGLNFGLGAAALGVLGDGAKKGTHAADELDDIAAAAEVRAQGKAAAPQPDAPLSPYDLTGKSFEDLGQRTDSMRPESLERLRNDPEFLATGRMRSDLASDYEQGISLGIDPEDGAMRLQDGRHRLQVAREQGIPEVHGTVRELGSGDVLYQGPIPTGAVRQGEREAVDGGLERALRNASDSDADDLVDRALADMPEVEPDSFGRQRRLYINREAIAEASAREMQKDLGALVEDVGKVARLDKVEAIAAHVGENAGAQRAVADGIAKDAAAFAGELRAEARAYGAEAGKKSLQYAIPGQKSLVLALMDHAKEVQKATTGKARFEALDSFKRAAQEMKASLEAGALNSPNPIHHQQLIPRIDTFAQKIRAALESADTWGEAGRMQKAYNAVISDKLLPHMRTFEEAVLQRTHRGYDGMWKMEGWENKISALLKNQDPGNRRHVGAVLDAMDELAAVRREFGDPKMAGRIEKQTAKVRRTIGLADEVADATERMKALGDIVSGVPMGGAIAGGLAGGLPGAAIGAALPGAVRGLVMGDLISAFQRLSGATEAATQRGVDDWIASSHVRGQGKNAINALRERLPQLSPAARQVRDLAARQGISQTMALFQGDDDSPASAFEKLRDKLLDEEGFFNSVAEEYGSLQEEAPEVFMALSARADLARRFLIARMPPNVAVSMANPDGYPPAREAIEDWAMYVNAVKHPTELARNPGGLSVQEVETLRTVYPRQHELMQQRVIEGIARAKELGTPLDDSALARIAILYPELDGLGSPVFSKEFGNTVRDYMAMQKQQGGGTTAPMKPKRPASLDATMEGGATFGMG